MVELTKSLKKFLWDNYKELLPLILYGHVELFTKEMQKEYLQYCKSEDGKKISLGDGEFERCERPEGE